MNNKIKIGVATVCMGALLLSIMLVQPSPHARMSIVTSAPTFDNNTAIAEIRVDNVWNVQQLCSFTENNTTSDVAVGQRVEGLQVKVYIHKDYASTSSEAIANTRMYITIEKPDTSTQWEGWIDNWAGGYDEQGDVWQITKRENLVDVGDNFVLTEGTWTITTKYEVYA